MSGGGGGRTRRYSDHGGRDDRRGHGRDSDVSTLPQVHDIFQGTVVSIMDYGAFVRIPGCIKNGLVHKSQISKNRVDHVSEVVSVNDRVWCKVISLGEDSNKISLSMKTVNQGSGQDLDPNGVQAGLDENRRKTFTPFSQPKIELEAVLNTVCKKCHTKGHLAQDCFQASSGKSYHLLENEDEDNDDDDDDDKTGSSTSPARAAVKKHKKEHKKHKAKKVKDRKKHKGKNSDLKDADEQPKSTSSADKKRKRKRQSSTSSSSSSSSEQQSANQLKRKRAI